ncbi:MAG: TetR/AcrR family transcriptional regulator [Firmicutes bacterium]|nr:TetR/AcrR family transcriptional regulator [Bacillota bacterium]
MAKKNERNTKGRIISSAWKLFYQQGYDDTTVDEIIALSGTSKGSFYHYFSGKDALLGTLSLLFDEKYVALAETMDPEMDCFEKLLYMNRELFTMVENEISLDLLARLYSSQLVTTGHRHLLDHNRYYYKLLKQTIVEGQKKGQISDSMTVNEIVKLYALCERSLLYDWCLCSGEYSLVKYASEMMPVFLTGIRK